MSTGDKTTATLRVAASLLVVAALPGAVIKSSIGGAAFYLLAILGLVLVLREPERARAAWRSMPELCLATLLLVGLNLASVMVFDLRARDFSWSPLLLMPLLALVAASGLVNARTLYASGALGAVAALGVALFDWLVRDQPRAMGNLNPIVFAQISLVCALYALAGLLRDPGRLRSLGYLAGTAAGIASVVASGTRGALLGLPLLGVFVWRSSAKASAFESTHRRVLISVALLLALGVGALAHRLGLWDRLARIDDEIAAYQEGTVGTRAVALRLALWKAAVDVAAENPLFGVGAGQFKPAVARLQAQGRYPQDAVVYSHAHNQPLTVLAEHGLIGIAALALAAWLAWRGLARSPPDLRRLGRSSLVIWLLLGMTNDIFAHQNSLRCLALCLALCAGMRARGDAPAAG